MGRKRTKPIIEIIPGYTAKQSQFLKGKITVDEIDGRFLRHLLGHAEKIEDENVIETTKALLEYFKEEKERRRIERSQASIRGTDIPLKKVLSKEYTKKEIAIIDGVMSGSMDAESIHGNILSTIASKANENNDTDIYNFFFELYKERMYEQGRRFWLMTAGEYDASGERSEDYKNRNYLTTWEKRVLECEIDVDLCSIEHLEHICKVAVETNDPVYKNVAMLKLVHKIDPMTACRPKQEAEELNKIKIRFGAK